MGTSETELKNTEPESLESDEYTLAGSFTYKITGHHALFGIIEFKFDCDNCPDGSKVVEVAGALAVADLRDIVEDHADSHMTLEEINLARAKINLPERSATLPSAKATAESLVGVVIPEPSAEIALSMQQTVA